MIIFFIAAAVVCVYVLAVSSVIRIKKIKISSRKLPKGFDGFKIAFLSDLHDSPAFGLVKKVSKISPDVIFLGGDMHERSECDGRYFSLLEKLGEIAPVYYVEGNHDARMKKRPDHEKYFSEFEKRVTVLNGKVCLSARGDTVDLYGCGYYELEKEKPSFDKDRYSVFLYHSPFAFDSFETPPDLMISGHVHGGVLDLPFIGGVFSPADGKPLFERFRREYLFPKYYKNTYEKNGGTLVVGRGIGNFKRCPLRFLPPEVLEITLCGER